MQWEAARDGPACPALADPQIAPRADAFRGNGERGYDRVMRWDRDRVRAALREIVNDGGRA